jgi:HSP20 family protein
MVIVRHNTYPSVEPLAQHLDRLFDNAFSTTQDASVSKASQMPAAEMYETDEAIHLKLEVPGFDPKNLDIQVTEQSVSIRGDRPSPEVTDGVQNFRSEFHYGTFERGISLPTRIQNTKVQAEYKNGILHLTLPKPEEVKNKVVKVTLN